MGISAQFKLAEKPADPSRKLRHSRSRLDLLLGHRSRNQSTSVLPQIRSSGYDRPKPAKIRPTRSSSDMFLGHDPLSISAQSMSSSMNLPSLYDELREETQPRLRITQSFANLSLFRRKNKSKDSSVLSAPNALVSPTRVSVPTSLRVQIIVRQGSY